MTTFTLLANVAAYFSLLAAWCSLHAKHLQREDPDLVSRIEQVLFSGAALPTTVITSTHSSALCWCCGCCLS